ncbi:uncharacterized protein LOC127011840 isoform X2 [Drosophila biarmipes]|uniref:uncharacterized protein LOC127011840 isoform X1 n=1 Tax=Drosophila biarmipes TaxID=125945 RepID=UPI0021CCC14D|nr:uncharacterized protein LOC127011840 isoform X1 [Drosophila biarmipes]XP_050746029.1 uncharacterized protein LOC127011840 isoform X2 [Drosophila biarmipes]XP_050746030.1 uncharacterized protein LOC127011840 isoform X1 [Drosophila biarmipes]XP_050746031.1 uncharacterized protein LOC127011840 isoform X1 [Drosophila biarmipes]XP_050746032.1 uncharacterized protein LOC127011840 isoform X2 [Drosophila biarmipes]XP_050746033.1 uncharacterized protein LOC127011840 isoform X2 [Drosophila biarmipes]
MLEMQQDVFDIWPDATECTLIVSYVFDGSTGHRTYKQRFQLNESVGLDHSLFVTTVIPLKLMDQHHRVIWINRTPQSVRFCRPLKIEFVKESTALILKEKKNLDVEIENLNVLSYSYKSNIITVKYQTHMTLIDGKVLNIVTGTNSCQSCPLCGAKPTQLLKTTDFNSPIFNVKSENLKYGVSPLHAWIRFMEFPLRISYRIEVKKWHVKGDEKLKVSLRRKSIQEKLWIELGLNVDTPKQNGSCNSNDGNTARRTFSTSLKFSAILDLDFKLIYNFYIILIAISSEHIITHFIVPVGVLGENASEARNKLYKSDRKSHARKCSRLANIEDVFHFSLQFV